MCASGRYACVLEDNASESAALAEAAAREGPMRGRCECGAPPKASSASLRKQGWRAVAHQRGRAQEDAP